MQQPLAYPRTARGFSFRAAARIFCIAADTPIASSLLQPRISCAKIIGLLIRIIRGKRLSAPAAGGSGLPGGPTSLGFPSAQARYLRAGKLSHRPAVALFRHRLFDNGLHLLDCEIFANEIPVAVTKAAIGLTLASHLVLFHRHRDLLRAGSRRTGIASSFFPWLGASFRYSTTPEMGTQAIRGGFTKGGLYTLTYHRYAVNIDTYIKPVILWTFRPNGSRNFRGYPSAGNQTAPFGIH